jgi:electron transfer flavoprotein alpha subunit
MSEAPEVKKPAGKKRVELDDRLKAYKGIWVFIEHERGKIHPVSLELLGEGRKLADNLGVELAGVVMGVPNETTRSFCNEAFFHGADLCYLMEDVLLTDYRNEPFTKGLTDLVNKYQPEIMLLGATTLGRDLAGSVATTLKTGLTADCTELNVDVEARSLLATRPTFGGSLLCTIQTLNYRPQMATVRPRVMPMPEKDTSRTGRIIEDQLGMFEKDIITKVLEFIPDAMQDQTAIAICRHYCVWRTRHEKTGELQIDLGFSGSIRRRGWRYQTCGTSWLGRSGAPSRAVRQNRAP